MRGYPGQVPLRLDLAEPRVDLAPLCRRAGRGGVRRHSDRHRLRPRLRCGAARGVRAAERAQGTRSAPALDGHVRDGPRPPRHCSRRSKPGLRGRARALLGRGATVLVPNPLGRYPHLCGDDPQRIGVRVSSFPAALARVIDGVGAILATSANLHGGADPRTLGDVPPELAAQCAVLVDGGPSAAGRAVDGARPERHPTSHPPRGRARHGGRARAHRLMPSRKEPT